MWVQDHLKCNTHISLLRGGPRVRVAALSLLPGPVLSVAKKEDLKAFLPRTYTDKGGLKQSLTERTEGTGEKADRS